MKKGLISVIFLSLVSFVVNAQQEVAVDPHAKVVLNKASEKFNTSKGFKAKLSIVVDNQQNGKKETVPADLLLKSEKFKLTISNVETYYDGKTEYVHLIKEKEVNVSEPKEEEIKDINPLLMLKSYQKDYKMKFIGESRMNNKIVEEVDLYPNDRSKSFSILKVYIDKETSLPVSIKTKGKNGIDTILNIVSYSFTNLDDKNFVFDFNSNKDVEVIDLR